MRTVPGGGLVSQVFAELLRGRQGRTKRAQGRLGEGEARVTLRRALRVFVLLLVRAVRRPGRGPASRARGGGHTPETQLKAELLVRGCPRRGDIGGLPFGAAPGLARLPGAVAGEPVRHW